MGLLAGSGPKKYLKTHFELIGLGDIMKIDIKKKNYCIITFDDFYNYTGWDVGEYKAFTETFNENEYKFLAFSKFGWQAAIQIL